KSGTPIIVATPGRLIDHLERGNLSLEKVTTVVLDEADKMIALGFRADMERILRTTDATKRNVWFFGATMSPELREIAASFAKTPLGGAMDQEVVLPQGVKQVRFEAREKAKPKLLGRILSVENGFYGLIFCQTKQLATE